MVTDFQILDIKPTKRSEFEVKITSPTRLSKEHAKVWLRAKIKFIFQTRLAKSKINDLKFKNSILQDCFLIESDQLGKIGRFDIYGTHKRIKEENETPFTYYLLVRIEPKELKSRPKLQFHNPHVRDAFIRDLSH